MNGYICFYKGKKVEVYADTAYGAKLQAVGLFRARKSYEVTVVLAEIAGAPVVHAPQDVCP